MPRRIKTKRILYVVGVGLAVVGFAVLPLLLLAVPTLLVALVMMVANVKRDLAWTREYKDTRHRIVLELLRAQLS